MPDQHGGGEVESFECGFTRGNHERICPKDPRFPMLEDYEIVWSPVGDAWYCQAFPKTDSARRLRLEPGYAATREAAEVRLKAAYISARDGWEAGSQYLEKEIGEPE